MPQDRASQTGIQIRSTPASKAPAQLARQPRSKTVRIQPAIKAVPSCAAFLFLHRWHTALMTDKDPVQPTDDDARALARSLLHDATFGALAVIDAATGAPSVTRIAIGTDPTGAPVTLISRLATHHAALTADNRCALLLGEPGPKGDPLTHPRMTLHCTAEFVASGTEAHTALRAHYLASHPKSKLYIDFPDFTFLRFTITGGLLNGGFGRAFRLAPADLVAALTG